MIENRNENYGLGFVGALQIAFIVLKLCNVINWKWWVVLLPSLISVSFIVVVLFSILIMMLRFRSK